MFKVRNKLVEVLLVLILVKSRKLELHPGDLSHSIFHGGFNVGEGSATLPIIIVQYFITSII